MLATSYTSFLSSCHFQYSLAVIRISLAKSTFENLRSEILNVSSSALSNRNSLLSQKLCHYLNEGRTLHGLFDLSKLKFDLATVLKAFES